MPHSLAPRARRLKGHTPQLGSTVGRERPEGPWALGKFPFSRACNADLETPAPTTVVPREEDRQSTGDHSPKVGADQCPSFQAGWSNRPPPVLNHPTKCHGVSDRIRER